MHPHSRCERRYRREVYINKRKFILLHVQIYSSSFYKIPYEHDHHRYQQYLRYTTWMEATDEEKKVLEVEHELDNPRDKSNPWCPPEPPQGWWRPPVWGKYSKFNTSCGCQGCRRDEISKRKRREKLKKDILESLEDC